MKEQRFGRGKHPHSIAALNPIKKGNSGNPNGKPKGSIDNRTAYLLGFNPRGAKDFDLGVKHRYLADLQERTLNAIQKSLINEDGELILLHSADIEIRYTVLMDGVPINSTARLSDLLTRLEEKSSIKILHAQQTKDLLKEAGVTANQFRQTLSDIADVLGIKKPVDSPETLHEREQNYDIFLTAISLISRRSLADTAFADIVSKLYFHKFGKIPDVHVQQWFENKFDEVRARCDEVPDAVEVRQLPE